MSDIAISNETDLDWLARNVHKWPCGKHQPWCYVVTKIDGERTWASNVLSSSFPYSRVDKDQWLARRAELQNKPSWDKAEDWAEWLAQDSYGCWGFFQKKPQIHALSWIARSGYYQIRSPGNLLLGDWRDTLEKRPEEFQPLTSIEDNQEQVMTKQQEMKQDNGWLERGELPPVGARCEALITSERQWVEIEVVCHRDGFALGWCPKERCGYHGDEPTDFRPIRTERDVLLSVIVEEMNHCDTDGKLADAILAAGFSLGAK